jgi:hypothetical protein
MASRSGVRVAWRGSSLVIARIAYLGLACLALAVAARGFPQWIGDWWVERSLAPVAARVGLPYVPIAAAITAVGFATALFFVVNAALITWRRQQSVLALFVGATLLIHAVGFVGALPQVAAVDPDWAFPIAELRTLDGVLALLFLYLFPDGRFVPRWTGLVWSVWSGWVFATVFVPGLSPILSSDEGWPAAVLIGFALSGLAAQTYRYRTVSTAHERLQTKWITYGLAIYVLVFSSVQLTRLLFPWVDVPGTEANLAFVVITTLADDLAAAGVAATITIALLRRRLLNIDLIISRTVVYFAATAIVAGLFAGATTAVQRLLVEVLGQRSEIATVAIALVVGAAFGPIKAYVQRVIGNRLGARA